MLLLWLFGLPYLDPPLEYGVTVNFGESDTGFGETQQASVLPNNILSNQVEETSPSTSLSRITRKRRGDCPKSAKRCCSE